MTWDRQKSFKLKKTYMLFFLNYISRQVLSFSTYIAQSMILDDHECSGLFLVYNWCSRNQNLFLGYLSWRSEREREREGEGKREKKGEILSTRKIVRERNYAKNCIIRRLVYQFLSQCMSKIFTSRWKSHWPADQSSDNTRLRSMPILYRYGNNDAIFP